MHLLNPELDDNILLVVANMTYGKQNQALKFNAAAPQPQTFTRPSLLDPNTGEMIWPVSYQFTVYFQQPIGGLASVSSGPMSTSLGDVFLDVESLYARYDFTIKTQSRFNWDWYDSVLVTVICQHLRQKNNRIAKSFLLDQHTTHVNYPLMLPDTDLWQFDVTKQYSNAANAPHIPATLSQAIGQDVFIFRHSTRNAHYRLPPGLTGRLSDKPQCFSATTAGLMVPCSSRCRCLLKMARTRSHSPPTN